MHHTATIVIDRPPVQVFYFMDDVSLERAWQPSLREADQHPPGPSKVGTRKRYVSDFLGKRVENTYVVVEVEPGRRLVTETTPDSTLDVRCEVTWEPEGVGTRVTMTVDGAPRGLLARMPARALAAANEREIRSSLERLKALIERRP